MIDRLKSFAFTRIGRRIQVVVGTVVGAGLILLVLFYADRQERNILAQNERTLIKVTESVIQGLRTVMQAGYANIGRALFDRLRGIGDITDMRILRTDGVEAFHDNQSIARVNARLGVERFQPRKTEASLGVLPPDDPGLRQAVATGAAVTLYFDSDQGEPLFTLLAPVANGPDCHECHGDDHNVRGVLKLTTSLAKVKGDIRNTWLQSIGVLMAAMALTLLTINLMVRRTIVRPIQRITRAMKAAARGDLSQEVPVLGHDELAEMAGSFNQMIRDLLGMYSGLTLERNKLSTILLGAQEGIIVTDAGGTIVLVNPMAEKLLGKPAARIIAEGLSLVLDDPQWMAERQARTGTQITPELVEHKDHIFSVLAGSIRKDDGTMGGAAVLIRDVTEEVGLRRQLQRQSDTDALTGLYNRRFFDQRLADEFAVARRYGKPLSVFLFDVDHFKKFNDTYGHDQGDRVLQTVGRVMMAVAEPTEVCCRYGGEEFVAILPGLTSEAAMAIAERLRAAVEAMRVDDLQVTISIGVASFPACPATQPDDLVKSADTAMYVAKQGGRNQVRRAEA